MKKRIIIGILIAALVAGGSAGGATYYKKSHQKTVSVVSVDNLAGQYYMDDTNLDGNIVTSAIQNITVDKDMIIQEVYVSKGDEVKKDDKLISFDMTLVQMELNIAKLKQQQQEQELNKATNRLNSLKNGGAIEESDADTSDTSSDSDTDTDSGMDGSDSSDDGDEIASVSGNVNGVYLAAVMNPILAAAVNTGDISKNNSVLCISDPDQQKQIKELVSELIKATKDIDNEDLKMAVETISEECNKPSWAKKTLRIAFNAIQGIATGIAANQLTPIITKALALLA